MDKLKKWWNEKDTQGKCWFLLKTFFIAIAVAYYLILALGRIIFPDGGIVYESLNVFNGSGTYNPWLRAASYAVVILSISSVVRLVLRRLFSALKRGKAVINLISSFIKYIAVIVLIFLCLSTFGVNTTALLAGAGILSLIVGLGAQPLLEDIIAGLFVIFEKTYDVNDIIVVDGFRGTVCEIGIRTTKIMDAGGDIKVVNNSDIRTLINMSNELSLAVCDVDVEYGESLERVEYVIRENLPVMREQIPAIVDGPYYKGVAKLGSSGVTLRFFAQCPETERYQTEREMNRQIKLIFDRNDIQIPFTQVVVHAPSEFKDATKKQKTASEAFIAEQRELSRGLGEQENK